MHNNSKSLLEQLYVPVVSFIKEIVGDREEAASIAVEIFDSDKIKTYDPPEDLTEITALLLKKSLIESFNFLRMKKGEEEAEKIFLEQQECFEASIEEVMIEQELRQLLEYAGGKLGKQQNLVLRLYFSGVQSADASTIMEITNSTFRNTKRTALNKYKSILKSGGFIVIAILLVLAFICVNRAAIVKKVNLSNQIK